MSEYISEEGLEKLKQDLHELKTVTRKEIAARLESAKALGDLAENAEYSEAKEAQSLNEARVLELEEMLRNIVVIQKPTSVGVVQIGSTVMVSHSGGEERYTIVGTEEANPAGGKISNELPLGKAFLGKKVGETVSVKTPAGERVYGVVRIE
jgi:transcription elongation factor GreA